MVVGQTQGGQGVAPIPLCQRVDRQQMSQPSPPQWESRWGAIATDGIRGSLGTSRNMSDQATAESNAMSDCQKKGGVNCSLDVSYRNACGAMLVGDHGYSVRAGLTRDDAVNNATEACSAKDKNCHVYYSDCSFAVRVH